MAFEPDDDRYVCMPEDQILAASGTVMALQNRWFSVHPERGLLFWQTGRGRKGKITGAAPQCNGDEATARQLNQRLCPWADVRFYPLVLAPIAVEDYSS